MSDMETFLALKKAHEPLELPTDPDHTNLCVVAVVLMEVLTAGTFPSKMKRVELAGAAMIPVLVAYSMGKGAAENLHEGEER